MGLGLRTEIVFDDAGGRIKLGPPV
jgi:hypothetical protein